MNLLPKWVREAKHLLSIEVWCYFFFFSPLCALLGSRSLFLYTVLLYWSRDVIFLCLLSTSQCSQEVFLNIISHCTAQRVCEQFHDVQNWTQKGSQLFFLYLRWMWRGMWWSLWESWSHICAVGTNSIVVWEKNKTKQKHQHAFCQM